MYPYPSGDLHIGHWYIKTPTDAIARFHRMHGDNVFLPIGFDAFGLPAENAAIKNGIHPRDWTMANIDNMRRQLRTMGATFDWERRGRHLPTPTTTAGTSGCSCSSWRPAWPTAQKSPVDWCPNDGTLAREQVEGADRHCWRCGAQVEKRDLEQWYLRDHQVRRRAARLQRASTGPSRSGSMQTNWIGRSEGAEIVFDDRARPTTTPGGERAARLHDPAGHAVRGDVHGPRARAPAGRDADRARPAGRGRGVRRAGAPAETEIERLSTDREKTGVADRRRRDQPGQRRADPDLRRRLRAGRLRHRRDHGRPGPRRARLRVRRAVRPADPARRRGARAPTPTTPMDDAFIAHAAGERAGQQRPVRRAAAPTRAARRSSPGWPRRGTGRADGHLPPARLADQPPALLGHADPGHLLPDATGSCRCPTRTCRSCCPTTVDYRGSGENPLTRDEAFLNVACPIVRRAGAARDRHDGHVHRLVLVLVSATCRRDKAGRRRSTATLVERWTPGRPVHRRRRARGHAPAVRRFFTKAMRDIGLVAAERAVQAAVQPGPDPGRRRRADDQVARQRPGPRRAGRAATARTRSGCS